MAKSKGTKDMMNKAFRAGIPAYIVNDKGIITEYGKADDFSRS
jgi:hypothetical protein